MFCRYCGKKVFEDSIFCSFCGKKLTLEGEEAAVGEPAAAESAFQSDPEFVWNLHEFPERRETEDINFTWAPERPPVGDTAEAESGNVLYEQSVKVLEAREIPKTFAEIAPSEASFAAGRTGEARESVKAVVPPSAPEMPLDALYGVSNEKKYPEGTPAAETEERRETPAAREGYAQESGADQANRPWEAPAIEAEGQREVQATETGGQGEDRMSREDDVPGADFAASLFGEIKEESQRLQESGGADERIDKFYTFNKKNEEFQQLLDREYERVKGANFSNPTADNARGEEFGALSDGLLFSPGSPVAGDTAEAEAGNGVSEQLAKALEAREIPKASMEIAPNGVPFAAAGALPPVPGIITGMPCDMSNENGYPAGKRAELETADEATEDVKSEASEQTSGEASDAAALGTSEQTAEAMQRDKSVVKQTETSPGESAGVSGMPSGGLPFSTKNDAGTGSAADSDFVSEGPDAEDSSDGEGGALPAGLFAGDAEARLQEDIEARNTAGQAVYGKPLQEDIIFDNDTLAKKFDTKEFNKDLMEAALEKAGIKLPENFEVVPKRDAYESDFKPMFTEGENLGGEEAGESKTEFSQTSAYDESVSANDGGISRTPAGGEDVVEGVSSEGDAELSQAVILEELLKEDSLDEIPEDRVERVTIDDLAIVDAQKQEAFRALEELWDSYEEGRGGRKSKKTRPDSSDNAGGADAGANDESVGHMTRAEAFSENEDGEGESGGRGRGGVWKVILTVVLVLVLAEIAVIGIRQLAPESGAAAFINENLSFAVMWLGDPDSSDAEDDPAGADDTLPAGDIDGEESQGTAQDTLPIPNTPAPPISEPEADKAALVAGQTHNNSTIEVVEANDGLKYNAENNYQDSEIALSEPIKDNVWYVNGDEAAYYDRAVVAALISFNSKWVDYVNTGDESILNYVKKGETAERNILNYSKTGKIEKTFKLLQIGEIRQYKNHFFVWTHEEVQDKEGGSTKDIKYDWVYRLEADGDKMLIVGYSRG